MKRSLAALLGVGIAGLSGGIANAASPAYCALYAREYARHATAASQGSLSPERVHDRAYFKCLNMDDEPPLPTAYTDPDGDGTGGPFVEEGSVAPAPEMAVDEPAVDAPVQATAAIEPDPPAQAPKKSSKWRGSGLKVGSAEWKDWCSKHFPNSFDPKTGTIVPLATGKRTACR